MPGIEIGVWNFWIPMVLFFLFIMLGAAFIITDIIEGIFKKHFPGKRWLNVPIFILLFIIAFYYGGLSLSGHLEDVGINMQEYGKEAVWGAAGALTGIVIMLALGSILKYFQKRRGERSTRNNQHDNQ